MEYAECIGDMTEKLTFDKLRRQAGRIDVHERTPCTQRIFMDELSQLGLANPGLSKKSDWKVGSRGSQEISIKLLHGR